MNAFLVAVRSAARTAARGSSNFRRLEGARSGSGGGSRSFPLSFSLAFPFFAAAVGVTGLMSSSITIGTTSGATSSVGGVGAGVALSSLFLGVLVLLTPSI